LAGTPCPFKKDAFFADAQEPMQDGVNMLLKPQPVEFLTSIT
jgi:hypothetical protein